MKNWYSGLFQVFILLHLFSVIADGQNDWVKVAGETDFSARDNGGGNNKALILNNKIWISGGWNLNYIDKIPDQWCSVDAKNWTMVNSMSGQYGLNLVFHDSLWTINPYILGSENGINWRYFGKGPPDGFTAEFKGKIWLAGQHNIYSSENIKDWTIELDSVPWPERTNFGFLSFNDTLWVIGGVNFTNLSQTYNDVWASPDGVHWTEITSSATWSPRRFFTPVSYKGKMWIIGGQDDTYPEGSSCGNTNDVWYSSNGREWFSYFSSSVFSPRHGSFTFNFEDKIYIVGGYANESIVYNDVWSLKIDSISITSQPVVEAFRDSLYTYKVRADFSRNNDSIKFRLINAPEWMNIDSISGLLTGIPSVCSPSDSLVRIEAFTNSGEAVMQDYTIRIFDPARNASLYSVGPDILCNGQSTELAVIGDFISYYWCNSDTAKTLTVNKSNEYTVVVRDSTDCLLHSDTLTITTVPYAKIHPVSRTYICEGDSVLLESWDVNYFYQWSTGDTTNSIYVREAADYYLITIDNNGCRDTSDIVNIKVKSLPAPLIVTSDSLCEGKENFLMTEQYLNYQWSNGEDTQCISTSIPGNYSVFVTDYQGCVNQSESVHIYPEPEVPVAYDTPVDFCKGESVELRSGNSFPYYRWNNGCPDSTLLVTGSGSYQLSVVDSLGCTGQSNPIDVNVHDPPSPILDINSDIIYLCEDDSVQLSTKESYSTYIWNNGSEEEKQIIRNSGSFFVTVTDTNGCTGISDQVVVDVILLPVSDFVSEIDGMNVSFGNVSSNASSFNWYFGDGSQSGETSPDHFYGTINKFLVTLVSFNGECTDTLTSEIQTLYGDYNIYPNPNSGRFKVELNEFQYLDIDLKITNFSGLCMYNRKIWPGERLIDIDITSLPPGLYILSLEYNGRPFVLEKLLVTGGRNF